MLHKLVLILLPLTHVWFAQGSPNNQVLNGKWQSKDMECIDFGCRKRTLEITYPHYKLLIFRYVNAQATETIMERTIKGEITNLNSNSLSPKIFNIDLSIVSNMLLIKKNFPSSRISKKKWCAQVDIPFDIKKSGCGPLEEEKNKSAIYLTAVLQDSNTLFLSEWEPHFMRPNQKARVVSAYPLQKVR